MHAAEQQEVECASYDDILNLVFGVVVFGNEDKCQLLELSDDLFGHIQSVNGDDVLEDEQDGANVDLGLARFGVLDNLVIQFGEGLNEYVGDGHRDLKVALHGDGVVVQIEGSGFLPAVVEDAGDLLESGSYVLVQFYFFGVVAVDQPHDFVVQIQLLQIGQEIHKLPDLHLEVGLVEGVGVLIQYLAEGVNAADDVHGMGLLPLLVHHYLPRHNPLQDVQHNHEILLRYLGRMMVDYLQQCCQVNRSL